MGYEPLQRDRPLPLAGAVLQKITIGQLDRNELFYVTPYIAIDKLYADITIDCPRQRLERNEHHSSHSLTYTLGTTAIVNREQLPLAPAAKTDYPITLTFVPKRDLPNLVKMAQEWIDESRFKPDHRADRTVAKGQTRLGAIRVQSDRRGTRSQHRSHRRFSHRA